MKRSLLIFVLLFAYSALFAQKADLKVGYDYHFFRRRRNNNRRKPLFLQQ